MDSGKKNMIYTVTFNPSLDYIVAVNDFALGRTNRTTEERILAGGKGINVSTVLKNCGIENTALGFIAGFTGGQIRNMAEESGLNCDFIELETGLSRINLKLRNYDGTEINGMGPVIDDASFGKLMKQLGRLQTKDVVVLAGSIPGSMGKSVYRDIMSELSGRGIEFVVDAAGELLLQVLEFHPFLIKPNNYELGELFGVKITEREQAVLYARKLQDMGARNVLVSMGGKGAVLADETGRTYMMPAPKGTLVNAVGAGDSMVAGFLAGWMESGDYYHAFKMAVSAGSASAFSELLATKEEILKLYNLLEEKF